MLQEQYKDVIDALKGMEIPKRCSQCDKYYVNPELVAHYLTTYFNTRVPSSAIEELSSLVVDALVDNKSVFDNQDNVDLEFCPDCDTDSF